MLRDIALKHLVIWNEQFSFLSFVSVPKLYLISVTRVPFSYQSVYFCMFSDRELTVFKHFSVCPSCTDSQYQSVCICTFSDGPFCIFQCTQAVPTLSTSVPTCTSVLRSLSSVMVNPTAGIRPTNPTIVRHYVLTGRASSE